MGQHLGLSGSQVPEADPIGNGSIFDLKNEGEGFDLVGSPVAIRTGLDLADYGFWYDKELRKGGQEVEPVDTCEENQR